MMAAYGEESENSAERRRAGVGQTDEGRRPLMARVGRALRALGADRQPLQRAAYIERGGRADLAGRDRPEDALVARQRDEAPRRARGAQIRQAAVVRRPPS